MSHLPVVSGREVVKALCKSGFVVVRQRGSHIRLRKQNRKTIKLTVPDHKALKRKTLSRILKVAEISVEEFKIIL